MQVSPEEEAVLKSDGFYVNAAYHFYFPPKGELPAANVRICSDSRDIITKKSSVDPTPVTWLGGGRLLNIPAYAKTYDRETQRVTFSLSGVDENLVALGVSEANRVRGCKIVAYLLLYDKTLKIVGAPIALYALTGDVSSFSSSKTGPATMLSNTMMLSANSVFALAGRSKLAFYTDREQRKITGTSAADSFCAFVESLDNKVMVWPKFG